MRFMLFMLLRVSGEHDAADQQGDEDEGQSVVGDQRVMEPVHDAEQELGEVVHELDGVEEGPHRIEARPGLFE